jgi:hypothetical protein
MECATIGEPPIAPSFPKFASFHQPSLGLGQEFAAAGVLCAGFGLAVGRRNCHVPWHYRG